MLRRYSFYEHVFGRAVNIKIVGGGFISPRAESYPASAADAHIPGASLTRSPINYNVPHHHGEKLVFRFAMQLTRSICSEKKKHDVVTKPKVKCSRRTIICLELYKKYLARFKPIFLESAKQNCNFCKGYHLSCKTMSWHVIQ